MTPNLQVHHFLRWTVADDEFARLSPFAMFIDPQHSRGLEL